MNDGICFFNVHTISVLIVGVQSTEKYAILKVFISLLLWTMTLEFFLGFILEFSRDCQLKCWVFWIERNFYRFCCISLLKDLKIHWFCKNVDLNQSKLAIKPWNQKTDITPIIKSKSVTRKVQTKTWWMISPICLQLISFAAFLVIKKFYDFMQSGNEKQQNKNRTFPF